jgi:hypothetical protein
MNDHIKNGGKLFFFLLLSVYVFPMGILVNHFRDQWLALLQKKEKNFRECLLFSWYILAFFPHYLILAHLEPFWREKVSVFKL